MWVIKYRWFLTALLFVFASTLHAQEVVEKGEAQPFFDFSDGGTKTLLNNGKILIVGGFFGTDRKTKTPTQVFDISSQEFFNSAPLHFSHRYPTTIPLDDGRVFVVGGAFPESSDASIPDYSPEVWFPQTKTWMLLEDIKINSGSSVYANKLDDGNVLLVADHSQDLNQSTRSDFKQFDAWLWNVKTNLVNHIKVPVSARQRAHVAILRDGRVFFMGGNSVAFDPEEHCKDIPIAEVRRQGFETGDWCDNNGQWNKSVKPTTEMWDSDSGKVTQSAYQSITNSFNYRAQQLRNGDVLIALDDKQAGVWQAASGNWRELDGLINYKRSHIIVPWLELPDGSLLGYKSKYSFSENKWLDTPPLTNQADIVGIHDGKVIALAPSEPYLRTLDEMQQTWNPVFNHEYVRLPYNLTLSLRDGRLLVAGFMPKGTSKNGEGQDMLLQLWNPETDSWKQQTSNEPELQNQQWVQLSMGDVLRTGLVAGGNLECRRWSIQAEVWIACDGLTLTPVEADFHVDYQHENQKPARYNFALGALETGAVMLVTSTREAQLFNEQTNSWMPVAIELNEQPLVHGYRIQLPNALYSMRDKLTQQTQDISSLVVRFRQADPTDNISADMLWDPMHHYWAYLFTQTRFSRNAALLPDGCAIAFDGVQFRLLNPVTETITTLSEPKPNIASGVMTVLSDGTVTVINSPTNNMNDHSQNFFARKASCKGFEGSEKLDTNSIVSVSANDHDAQSKESGSSTKKINSSIKIFFTHLWDWLKDHKGIAPAILVPFVLYFFLKWIIRRNKKHDREIKVSSNGGFVVRIIIYGGLGVLFGPLLFNTLLQSFSGSSTKSNTPEELWFKQHEYKNLPNNLNIPCRFVGFWRVKNNTSGAEPAFLYSLYDDGHLQVQAMRNGSTTNILYSGQWAYRDKELIWLRDAKDAQLQTDRVINYNSSTFTLQQADGQFLEFLHVANLGQHHCTQDSSR